MKKVLSVKSRKWHLPLLIISVIIPMISVANFYATKTVSKKITQEAKNNFVLHSKLLADTIQEWNNLNDLALINLSNQIDITNSNYSKQKKVLKEIVGTYEHLYLAHVINSKGWDIARSDEQQPKYYGDRNYFKEALGGKKISYQTIISRTSKQPSLCLATPTYEVNKIEGVTSICTELKALTKQIGQLRFGQTGYAFLIDKNSALLAHPNLHILSKNQLTTWSEYPPVKNHLQNKNQIFSFTDKDHVKWISYSTSLNNGWILIIQQQETEFISSTVQFQKLAWLITLVLIFMIIIFTFWINNYWNYINDSVTAINHYKSDSKVIHNSKNDLALLTNSFEQVKEQIQDILTNIEQIVEPKKAKLKKGYKKKNIMMK